MRVTLTARVQDGKLETDKPVELPDGTEVDVVVVAGADDRADQGHHEAFLMAVNEGLVDVAARRVIEDGKLDEALEDNS